MKHTWRFKLDQISPLRGVAKMLDGIGGSTWRYRVRMFLCFNLGTSEREGGAIFVYHSEDRCIDTEWGLAGAVSDQEAHLFRLARL